MIIIGIKRHKEIKDFIHHRFGARVGAVNFIDDHNRLQPLRQSFAQNEFGLRHRAFGGVRQEDHAIGHMQNTFHLTTEISVAGRVDNIDANILAIGILP